MARQKHLERSAYDVALGRLQQQAETLDALGIHNPALNRNTLQKWMWEWHIALRKKIETEIQSITEVEKDSGLGPGTSTTKTTTKTATKKRNGSLLPFLLMVKAERLSLITILEIMRLQGTSGLSDGMKTTRALVSVGKAVEMEYKAQMCKKNRVYVPKDRDLTRGDFYSLIGYKHMQERRAAVEKDVSDSEEWSASWSQTLRSKIGGILVDCLMEVAEVERTAVHRRTGETVYVFFFSFFPSPLCISDFFEIALRCNLRSITHMNTCEGINLVLSG